MNNGVEQLLRNQLERNGLFYVIALMDEGGSKEELQAALEKSVLYSDPHYRQIANALKLSQNTETNDNENILDAFKQRVLLSSNNFFISRLIEQLYESGNDCNC